MAYQITITMDRIAEIAKRLCFTVDDDAIEDVGMLGLGLLVGESATLEEAAEIVEFCCIEGDDLTWPDLEARVAARNAEMASV